MEDPAIHPMILESGLVLLATVLGGLLLTPMTRTTISYMAATNTPDWAEKRIGTSAGTRLLLNINLLLPGLVALIWVSHACWTVSNTFSLQNMLTTSNHPAAGCTLPNPVGCLSHRMCGVQHFTISNRSLPTNGKTPVC